MINEWRKQLFLRFVDKRNPAQDRHRLKQSNLYIFPSRFGLIYLAVLAVLWVMGTNYQNNLVIGLVFFLLSIFLVSILHTYRNMSGLELVFSKAPSVFCGEDIAFIFKVTSNKPLESFAIECEWQDSPRKRISFSLKPECAEFIAVSLPTTRRGLIYPPRLLVQSQYPFGLFRCWTWLRWSCEGIVYPAPLALEKHASIVSDDAGDGGHPVKGGEDFDGLQEYRAGDPLKHVAWKAYAKGQGLQTKSFSQNISLEHWLDFESAAGRDVEQKLSGMCYWALQFHDSGEPFGLKLPGTTLGPNNGDYHIQQVLRALGSFNVAKRGPGHAHS